VAHAEALHTVVARGRCDQTYHICGHNKRQDIDLVRLRCGLLDELLPRADGKPYAQQITFVTDRPGHDLRYAIDATKITSELGGT
jgi:dTDP-glucose 4,6-dehydratase